MIASRMAKLDSSGIRKVFDLAAQLENPVNLSIGQPDFDVPQPVKQAAIAAIETGNNRYTVTQGIPDLHDALREMIRAKKAVDADHLLVTSGVSGALLLSFLVLLDPGDEVLIPDPYFVMYKHLANLVGGTPVFVNTYPDFRVTAERIEPMLTARSKILVLNSPGNPTGAVMTEDDVRGVAELVADRDILVISDEIYDAFVYDGACTSAAAHIPNCVLMGGFSKSHAMTGWRLGYAAGPADVIAEMTKLQQFSFVCAPSIAQYAGLEALKVSSEPSRKQYQAKRDRIYRGLKDYFEVERPDGAFYIFPRVPWGTDMDFVAEAIRSELLIIPGSVFSEKHTHFRISYAADDKTIDSGIEILCRLAEQGGQA